ncbi:hypothetical protein DXM22_22800 [Agrobacterium vitis]|nr:hypothetical protein DXM22_22800 [Agrobacterium vitis]RCU54828.1 hypothetical protein ASB66_007395 [Agrobacterium vitis]
MQYDLQRLCCGFQPILIPEVTLSDCLRSDPDIKNDSMTIISGALPDITDHMPANRAPASPKGLLYIRPSDQMYVIDSIIVKIDIEIIPFAEKCHPPMKFHNRPNQCLLWCINPRLDEHITYSIT